MCEALNNTSYSTIHRIHDPYDTGMPFLPFSTVYSLRKELDGTDAEIVTWGCDGYGDSIEQWSQTCDTYVVSCYYRDSLFPADTDLSRARLSGSHQLLKQLQLSVLPHAMRSPSQSKEGVSLPAAPQPLTVVSSWTYPGCVRST